MKKVAIGVVVVAVLAALFFVLRGGGGDRPMMAEALPAAHTAGLSGVQALDAVGRRWLPVAKLIDPALTPEKISAELGFDPTTAEGWRSVGVDPAAGIGLALDARVTAGAEPVPLILVKLVDEQKALAWVTARSGQPAAIEGEGAVRALVVAGQRTPIGRRGDWTVILGESRGATDVTKAGFAAFVEDGGDTLDDAPIYVDAFAGAEAPRLFWWGGASAAGSMMAAFGAPETVTSTVDFYATMFPAVASWLGESGASTGGRLLATEKGLALVRKLFVPQRRNPKVARYVGAKGWGAVRFSANLSTVLDGVGEAMPPAAAQAKAAVGMARMMLPMAAGVNWDDIAAGLSGHAVIAGDAAQLAALDAGGIPDALLLLGVNDETKADALIGKLIDRAKSQVPGISVTDVEMEGEKGRLVAMGPMKIALVRADDVLIVGPEASVQAALKRADGEHLEGPHADALDGDALWAVVADLAPALAELEKAFARDPSGRNPLKDPLLAPFAEDPRVLVTAELDGKGILWRGRTAVPLDVLTVAAGAWFWTMQVPRADAPPPMEPAVPPAPVAPPQ